MRKLISLIAFLIIGVGLSFAGNPLRLMEGSLLTLKNSGGTIRCELDFSKTKANRKPLAEYLKDDFGSDIETFRQQEPDMLKWFTDRWDDDIEKGPKVSTSKDAEYTVKVIVKNLQMGSKSGFGGASISGYAEFYRKGETAPFAKVEILKMNGTIMGGAMFGYHGLKQCFNDLAEYLCDLVYHSK